MTLDEAEYHVDKRRFARAWAALDEVPLHLRSTPRAWRVRLRCCTGLARWDEGKEIAVLLADGEFPDRECAAGFYHMLAVAHLQDRDVAEARSAAERAIAAWKPARIEMLRDNRLAGLF